MLKLLPRIALVFISFNSLVGIAYALPDFIDGPRLEFSDLLVKSNGGTVTVTVRGKPNDYFLLALNNSQDIWKKGGDGRRDLDGSAKIVGSGRFDLDGRAEVNVVLPKSLSGKIYFQALTGRKSNSKEDWKFWFRDEDVSSVLSVASLEDLLKLIQVQSVPGPQGPAGPAGPQGATGPQGPAGPKGEKGEKGDSGIQGAQGVAGPVGPSGPTGIQGLKGDRGDTGAQGLKGDKGEQGIQGIAGLKGDTGADGAIGPQGLKGDQGVAGPKGDIGATGPTGPQGIQGMKGDKGDKGDTGTTGAQGIAGVKGDHGEAGIQGPIGPQGPQGIPGPAGVTPVAHCPTGWLDLGPTCMEPNFDSSGTIDQAIQECYQMGARICEHQDLAFACQNRDNISLNFPDNTWLHTGSITLRSLGGSSTNTFVGYATYRRMGTRCFGPSTINPSDAVVSYDLASTARNYACCADRGF